MGSGDGGDARDFSFARLVDEKWMYFHVVFVSKLPAGGGEGGSVMVRRDFQSGISFASLCSPCLPSSPPFLMSSFFSLSTLSSTLLFNPSSFFLAPPSSKLSPRHALPIIPTTSPNPVISRPKCNALTQITTPPSKNVTSIAKTGSAV